MKTPESGAFYATAIPAGVLSLALVTGLAWTHTRALAPIAGDLALTTVFAIFSYLLSFSVAGPGRVSLELAYFIAAALVLPFPAAMLVGAIAALAGSILRVDSGLRVARLLAVTGANVTIATLMTGAACAARVWLSPLDLHAAGVILPHLALSAALFVAMNLVNLAAMTAWVASRGDSPAAWARNFLLRIFPVEAMTVPFACLLVFVLETGSGHLAFTLLGAIGLFVSFLLKTLSDSQERLHVTNLELEDRVAELATLNAIGREITSSLDPARLFKIIRRECRKIFQPDFFMIARVDQDSHEVTVEHSMAGEVPSLTRSFPLGQGLTSHVVRTERPLLVQDASRDTRMKSLRPIVLEPKIRSILAVPLIVDGRVIGVLSIQCFRDKAYDERHVPLLTTIAQQAAVALENARHYQLATVDCLTGLYQRDYFFQRLGDEHRRAARYGSTFSLLMLDIDSFKKINDRFGHFAGDRFLKAVGAAIKTLLRAADIPCRYGGEEFCVLLPETDLAGARTIAERIRMEVGALRIQEGTHLLSTTVSIGVSSYPVHFEGNLTGLLQKADQALYSAKKQGKDRVIAAAA